MILAIVNYSPLEFDYLVPDLKRSFNDQKQDITYSFEKIANYKSKVLLVFNTKKYCQDNDIFIIEEGKSITNMVLEVKRYINYK